VSHFDDFFRANYRGMVGYCIGFGYREPDVEEEVADVIMRHYDDYRARVEGPAPDRTMRSWMNRRVLLNLRSKALRIENAKVDQLQLGDEEGLLHFDDPESILDLKQRMPHVPPILVRYEPYGGAGNRGANTSTDKSYYCRERKKFLTALADEKRAPG
jgi:hypothetical protein